MAPLGMAMSSILFRSQVSCFRKVCCRICLSPRRNRAAEQRSEEGDIACGVDVLGIHPQLQPETSPRLVEPCYGR